MSNSAHWNEDNLRYIIKQFLADKNAMFVVLDISNGFILWTNTITKLACEYNLNAVLDEDHDELVLSRKCFPIKYPLGSGYMKFKPNQYYVRSLNRPQNVAIGMSNETYVSFNDSTKQRNDEEIHLVYQIQMESYLRLSSEDMIETCNSIRTLFNSYVRDITGKEETIIVSVRDSKLYVDIYATDVDTKQLEQLVFDSYTHIVTKYCSKLVRIKAESKLWEDHV